MKIAKDRAEQKEAITKELEESFAKVEKAIDEYNGEVRTAWTALEEVLSDHRLVLANANGFTQSVTEEIQSDFDEKSERWQESAAGEKVRDMISEWDVELDEPDIAEPEDVEFDDEPLRSFRDLPEES